MALKLVIYFMKKSIKKKAKYNIDVLNGVKMIEDCTHLLPNCMFVYSKEDTFVSYHHCLVNLYYSRGCFKSIMAIKISWKWVEITVVKGLLNSANKLETFLSKGLRLKNTKEIIVLKYYYF